METSAIIAYIVLPVCSVLIIPLIKNYFSNIEARIRFLETSMLDRPTEKEVKEIVIDKLEPMKQSLEDIKERIDKLTDYVIHK